jgi:hypothetical protein
MVCDHPVRQFERYESAESRINLLRGTSRRHCDVDETRDWSRQSKRKTINFQLGDDSIGGRTRARKRQFLSPGVHIFHISTEGKSVVMLSPAVHTFHISTERKKHPHLG